MASLHLSLPDEMSKFIDQSAKAGDYAHPSAFVRALIRREMENNETLGLIASVHRGLADIEHGRYHTFDAEKIRTRAREKLAAKQT